MILTNPEARRGLRSIIQAIAILALIGLAWWLTGRLTTEDGLREVARWSLGIVGLMTLGYIMENGLRAFKLSAGKDGVSVEAGGE